MSASLWGEEFDIQDNTEELLKKMKSKKTSDDVNKQLKSDKLPLSDRLDIIKRNVLRILGHYTDNTLVIKDKETLIKYIDKSIENGVIAIDTETNNSLDPLTCKLMGPCLYTPDMKQAYIPLNHVSPITEQRLEWQLTEEDIKEQFQRLLDNNVKIIMHNGKFDYQVIKCTCDIELTIDWDTMIGARLLNENEKAGLKSQYISKIDSSQEKYNIEHLFNKVQYAYVEPEIFALYAATDSYITYQLYLYQKEIFEKQENSKLYNLFKNIEMPVVTIVAEMELTGITIDTQYAKRLSEKYHKILDEYDRQIAEELQKLKPTISAWRLTEEANRKEKKDNGKLGKSKSEQLPEEINLASATQMAILFYDILKVPTIDKKKPRTTDKATLDIIADKYNIPLAVLKKKRAGISILLDTFIDKLVNSLNPKTHKIHCDFNQIGADTGRFSSSNPNMQNIPSHAFDIRGMFRPSKGYKLIGSDYSGQEARITAACSKCPSMINAYKEGKDLYVVIAQQINNNRYEDNLEFYPEGTEIEIDGKKVICGKETHVNVEGKARRSQAKQVLLALTYGMGVKMMAERIGKTVEEAQTIMDNFFKSFPEVKQWMDDTYKKVKKTGYVEDFMGRRRRLSDVMLKPYEITSMNSSKNFLLCCDDNKMIDETLYNKYMTACKKIKTRNDYNELKSLAEKDNLILIANTDKIAQAERQSVNAIVQGGAATLTKIAMIDIYNDEILNKCKFRILLQVHDEIIGECPEEFADVVSERLPQVMMNAAKKYIETPMVCNPYCVDYWYEDELNAAILKDYKKLKEKYSGDELFEKLEELHSEMTEEELKNIIAQ